jgi:endo-1,4-beta-xylanase
MYAAAEPPIPSGQPLREIAARIAPVGNVYIGGTTALHKPSYTSGLLDREFSYITPENDFKQSTIHPRPGVWNWEGADAWLEHAVEQRQVVRLHGPISPQVSKWTLADNRRPEELEQNLVEFMTALCQRYNGHPQVKWMDVVNETVVPRTGEWFGPKEGVDDWENPWPILGFDETYKLRPPLYIKKAFQIANQYAPDIEQIINQHGGMEAEAWKKVCGTVLYLRQQGLRVDGIGWQAHVDVGWEKQRGNLERLGKLIDWAHANHLSFHITENNVWLREKPDYAAQAETFAAILRVLLSRRQTGVVTWNVWNLSDDDAWHERKHLNGSIFDRDYAPKPAYYAIQRELLRAVE